MSEPATAPTCPHRPPCPGCPRFGATGIAPAALGALESLARAHGIATIEAVTSTALGARLRARLAIRDRRGQPVVGMFEAGTHEVVAIPDCAIHHPLINRVARVVRRALVDARVPPYVEHAHSGIARYLQVVIERSTQRAQVVLVCNASTPEPAMGAFERIRDWLGDDLHSLWFNSQQARTNTILGARFERLHGAEAVVERYGGAAVHYPPGAFGQNNLDMAERIIEYVRGQVPTGARVGEFYAGVGAIGLSLLAHVSSIRMNEISPASLQGLAAGLDALSPTERNKVVVIPGTAGASATVIAEDAEVVIADPPRKGLDRELVDYLSAHPPARLIYVSCGFESLLTDTARLTGPGRLRLTALKAFDLMPYTEHVETVATFDRLGPALA